MAAWQETYPGLMPAAMIAAGTLDRHGVLWTRILGDPQSGARVWVAEAPEGLAGFGACQGQRSADLAASGFDGEISALDVLRTRQRQGIGRALLGAAAAHLDRAGHCGASLWVLRENDTARRFYDALGGVVIGETVEVRPEGRLEEVAYGWRDLAGLGAACGARPGVTVHDQDREGLGSAVQSTPSS